MEGSILAKILLIILKNKKKHLLTLRFTPQANGLAKSIKRAIKNILRIYKGYNIILLQERIHNYLNHSHYSRLKTSPHQLVFGTNSLDIWGRDCREAVTIRKKKFLVRKNSKNKKIKLSQKNWCVGSQVLVKHHSLNKMECKFEGPFTITQIDLENNKLQVQNDRKRIWESLRNIKPFE